MSDLDEKIKEAAAKYPFDFEEVFTAGANFVRELMQKEVDEYKELSNDMRIANEVERELIGHKNKTIENLREQLAVAIGFLEELYFYDTCTACDNNFDMRDKALSKIKGGAE